MQWDNKFATRTELMGRSTIREILKVTAQPDIISFAGGLPAPELFPVDRFRQMSDEVLSEQGSIALQYSPTEGMLELRELIAGRLSGNGLTISSDNVLIVSGSQQGLDLLGRVLLDDKDSIIVENPTYLGMLMAWKTYYLNYFSTPTDVDGMQVNALPELLAQHPKLAYIVPNFQNPGGNTLSLERRYELVKLLAEYQVPLIEDNAYGELCYDGEPLPSLLQLDAQHMERNGVDGGHVIYLGTFSKILSPGMRVGWIVADTNVIDKLVQAKQSADLHTSTLNQYLTYAVAKDGFLDGHIEKIRDVYRERRDVMIAAMEEHFPEEVTFSRPIGGLFLLVTAPEGVNTTELLEEAIKQKVAFVPGADFHIGGSGANTFRLNFSNAKPEQIRTGIERLGTLLKTSIKA